MINFKVIITVVFLFLFVPNYAFSTENKVDINYSEDIRKKLGQYSDDKELYEDLKLKALTKAVNQLLSQEIERIKPFISEQNIENIIDVSRDFIKYDKMETGTGNELMPNVVLKNCYVSRYDKIMFNKIQIASNCNYNSELLKKQREEIEEIFAESIRSAEPNFKAMMNDPKQLKSKTTDQLSELIHQENVQKAPNTLENTKCKSFFVYPIEIYAASSVKKITPVITIQPSVEGNYEQDKTAEFQLIVVGKDYNWKIGSTEVVEKIGIGEQKNFPKKFHNSDFKNIVRDNFIHIIGVGVASCDGNVKYENNRAKERALKLIKWLKDAFNENKKLSIYGLNWGKHKYSEDNCMDLSSEEKASQRNIVLIGVTKKSKKGVNIEQALENAITKIEKDGTLPINRANYHNFKLIWQYPGQERDLYFPD